jgi:Tripartite tricarboxylate transporter family receptor
MVNLHRRQFLHLVAGAAAVAAIPPFALALDYPTRPVAHHRRLPAASATDVVARLIAQSLSERLDQQVVVEDRSGAGSNIAAQTVVHAAQVRGMLRCEISFPPKSAWVTARRSRSSGRPCRLAWMYGRHGLPKEYASIGSNP